MAIFAISDLHLSFNTNKSMNIFGWDEYEEEIKKDWQKNVEANDLVLLSGDFSWEMKLENTYKDFKYINDLPGKKLLLKGNHDYWWNTVSKMRKYIEESKFDNIDFIYNNSYLFDNKVIVGTRGWNLNDEIEDDKIRKREALRLELSIKDGIEKYGSEKTIIACLHYPPLLKNSKNTIFTQILEKYNINTCIYGHLHGQANENAFEGEFNNVRYIMVSCDYTKFKLVRI